MSDIDAWVSAEFERLAQVINDYDQHLFLEFIPPERQADLDDKNKCFRIVDDRNNKIVLYADSLSNPVAILERLWNMDSAHGNVLNRLDTHNAAIEAFRLRGQLDEREAIKDCAAFVGKNQKSRWTHEGRVKDEHFRDLGPVRKVIT